MTSCSRVPWTDYMSIKVTCTSCNKNQTVGRKLKTVNESLTGSCRLVTMDKSNKQSPHTPSKASSRLGDCKSIGKEKSFNIGTPHEIYLNQSNPLPEYFGYMRSSHDSTLLVSPLVVAGIVIGLVLFLSCVTIIIGSLRKDGRERDWRLQNPSYDGISYAPSFGDLSSVCTGDMSPALDFASYLGLSVSYPDFPPCYEECVVPGSSGSYLPTDEPPPYSLEDPQQLQRDLTFSDNTEEIALRLHENTENNLIPASLSAADLRDVSPSRTTSKTSLHLPIIPMDIQKHMASPTTLVL